MKKLLTLLIAMVCAFAPVSAFAIDVNIDHKHLIMDVKPTTLNGRTMVPMRSIFEALGAEVEWNPYTRGITAHKDGSEVVLYLNETVAYLDGVGYRMDTPAVSIDGRTMVPIRFVSNCLGCYVFWDNYEKLVSIFSDKNDAYAYSIELEQLNAKRKAEQARIAAEKAAAEKAHHASTQKGQTVYVTATGKKYHYSGSCNGGTH